MSTRLLGKVVWTCPMPTYFIYFMILCISLCWPVLYISKPIYYWPWSMYTYWLTDCHTENTRRDLKIFYICFVHLLDICAHFQSQWINVDIVVGKQILQEIYSRIIIVGGTFDWDYFCKRRRLNTPSPIWSFINNSLFFFLFNSKSSFQIWTFYVCINFQNFNIVVWE